MRKQKKESIYDQLQPESETIELHNKMESLDAMKDSWGGEEPPCLLDWSENPEEVYIKNHEIDPSEVTKEMKLEICRKNLIELAKTLSPKELIILQIMYIQRSTVQTKSISEAFNVGLRQAQRIKKNLIKKLQKSI
jgi:DNA-directed RNA polymerase specialized sigma subunit